MTEQYTSTPAEIPITIQPSVAPHLMQFSSARSGEEVIHQAIGAGSMCWQYPERAGIFDSSRAATIGRLAMARLRELSGKTAALADAELIRENRTLRWKLKTLAKQNGRQGQVIHELRNKVDALTHTSGLRSMGDYRALLERCRAGEAENRRLREKLDAR